MSKSLGYAQEWLVADQYPHGEWGRCETTDPTADTRTLLVSRIKPHLFISSQAALALKATGYPDESPNERFFHWLAQVRHQQSGFWTNASGTKVPMIGGGAWSEVKNVRHTAKALDLYLLAKKFTAGDASVLHDLLSYQLADGAFPQNPSEAGDLWSTAYTINLLIRAAHQDHLNQTIPRGSTPADWGVDLRNKLARARAWICNQIQDGLWRVDDKPPVWISEAVLVEIGADLALHRSDVALQVARKVWREGQQDRRGQTLWAMLLVFQALDDALQTEVRSSLESWREIKIVRNTFDMACSVRAFALKANPEQANILLASSDGHESLMRTWTSWQPEVARQPLRQDMDFAIISIRDDEFEAVLKFFSPYEKFPGARRDYFVATVRSCKGREFRVAMLRAHEQGHGSAQAAAADVIADLNPRWLLLVGIAGAVPESEFSLGDVVLASRVADFSVTAALPGGDTEYAARGGPAHKAVQEVVAQLVPLKAKIGEWGDPARLGVERPAAPLNEDRFVGPQEWRDKVKLALASNFGPTGTESKRLPRATSASVGSGNKLMKDPELLQEWLSFSRDLKAVEMELPGVYEAARDRNGDRPVLAIRGISDVIGYKRSPEWTAYACLTAASFTHALIIADAINP